MSYKDNQSVTTHSMIVAGVIESFLKRDGYQQLELFERTNITQPTWARLCKGHSKLDIEHLYSIQENFGYNVSEILKVAESVEQQVKNEKINVVPPIPTSKGKLTATDGVMIVALGVLAFMAYKELKRGL